MSPENPDDFVANSQKDYARAIEDHRKNDRHLWMYMAILASGDLASSVTVDPVFHDL